MPITQLLEFMRINTATGRLILSAQPGVASLTVAEGQLTAAACSNRPNLGDRLVGYGWLDRATLDTWQTAQPRMRRWAFSCMKPD